MSVSRPAPAADAAPLPAPTEAQRLVHLHTPLRTTMKGEAAASRRATRSSCQGTLALDFGGAAYFNPVPSELSRVFGLKWVGHHPPAATASFHIYRKRKVLYRFESGIAVRAVGVYRQRCGHGRYRRITLVQRMPFLPVI